MLITSVLGNGRELAQELVGHRKAMGVSVATMASRLAASLNDVAIVEKIDVENARFFELLFGYANVLGLRLVARQSAIAHPEF